jgi:hypothetical protein
MATVPWGRTGFTPGFVLQTHQFLVFHRMSQSFVQACMALDMPFARARFSVIDFVPNNHISVASEQMASPMRMGRNPWDLALTFHLVGSIRTRGSAISTHLSAREGAFTG